MIAAEQAAIDAAFSDGAHLTIKPHLSAIIPSRDAPGVVVPKISDFAREISREVAMQELDQADFDAAVEALAAEVPCPSLGTLTYAAEFLNDHVLPAYVGDMSDAELNWQAVCAFEFSPEFRNCFAYSYLNSIVATLNERHARDVRESIRTARAGGE